MGVLSDFHGFAKDGGILKQMTNIPFSTLCHYLFQGNIPQGCGKNLFRLIAAFGFHEVDVIYVVDKLFLHTIFTMSIVNTIFLQHAVCRAKLCHADWAIIEETFHKTNKLNV